MSPLPFQKNEIITVKSKTQDADLLRKIIGKLKARNRILIHREYAF